MLFGLTTAEIMDGLASWFKDTGWQVLVVILVIYIGRKFGNLLIARTVKRAVKSHKYTNKAEEEQREKTLMDISATILRVTLWVVGGLTIFSTIGFDIAPLLASAGIVGIALGFGAQDLVKDWLAGLYVITENQYRVGDVVSLDGTSGVVQRLTLRHTVLRDLDGNVHHIANGTFTIATNMTFEYSQVNLDVGVGYSTDLDKLEEVINQVCESLSQDEKWADVIVETPAFLRIDALGDSSIVAKIVGKTKPMQQWAVAGEMRKRLKNAFDETGIEIPFPQIVVNQPANKVLKKKQR